MKVLIVGNQGDSDPGLVGARLLDLDFKLAFSMREFPREWKSIAGIDLLLLLGSEWSVYSEHNGKEVAAEVDLVRTAMKRGVPIFAICFGAQVISRALGGSVARAPEPEVGWRAVSSAFSPELLQHSWLQWHYDIFNVPASLQTVASNEVGPQAMLGRRVFATQFHPEATTEIIKRWSSGKGVDELHSQGIDPKSFVESSRDCVARQAPVTARLVDWFLTAVSTDN